MTYAEGAKNNRLFVTLRELGIDESTSYGLFNKEYDLKLLTDLVMFTPTNQSHLGDKFNCFTRLNKRNLDKFLSSLFSGLGINDAYLFESYTEKTKRKKDLRKDVLNNRNSMICLRCESGVRDSLYMSVRNSIAHGNLLERDGFLILYAISDDKEEFDSPITFFMRIKKVSSLKAFTKSLEAYR